MWSIKKMNKSRSYEQAKKYEQIQWTKLDKMATFLALFEHFNANYPKSWYNPAPELLLIISYKSYQSEYAVSDQSNQPNSIKLSKTSFLAPFSINYVWPKTIAKCWKPFCTTIICNIKSITWTKLERMAENPYFCINYANYA